MCDYGSLFLWHLKLEGKPKLGQAYLRRCLRKLKPFKSHLDETLYYKRIFLDIFGSSSGGRLVNECDLSVLFTIARNVCMILAHKQGCQAFGRRESFDTAFALCPRLPLSRCTYEALSEWKAIYECRVAPEARLPNSKKVRVFVRQMKELLDYAEGELRRTH